MRAGNRVRMYRIYRQTDMSARNRYVCQNRSRNVEPVKPSLPGPYVIPLVNFDIARRPLSAARECSTGPSGSSPDSRTGSVRTGTDLGTVQQLPLKRSG